jgi:hypothetical protein
VTETTAGIIRCPGADRPGNVIVVEHRPADPNVITSRIAETQPDNRHLDVPDERQAQAASCQSDPYKQWALDDQAMYPRRKGERENARARNDLRFEMWIEGWSPLGP